MTLLQPMINLRNLKVERDITILKGIDWRVEPGQHWAILGPNGCGKTTLLQALTAYVTPTSGEMQVCGQTYGQANWPELRKRVGVVSSALLQRIEPNETALNVVLSGKDAMLNFWGKAQPSDVTKARRFLRLTGIRRLAERPWRFLSQGERQRALIARALLARPVLLLLDEPCAGLDPIAREDFLIMIQKLCQQPRGPVLVLVTHHIEEIVPGISHVLLMTEGKIIRSDTKPSVLTSANLSRAFNGRKLQVRCVKERYRLEVRSNSMGAFR